MTDHLQLMVVGAGQMGQGIAQVAAQHGWRVVLIDVDEPALERARQNMNRLLQRDVLKGRMQPTEADETLARIELTIGLAAASRATYIIEAVPENLNLKKRVFRQLDDIAHPDAILASNTSSYSITHIAGATERPERVVGMHFFYPVPRMPLLEIIPGRKTSSRTIERALQLADHLGKRPVQAPDSPGFLVNRVLLPMLNEAAYLVMEGADPHDVDVAMKWGTNHPMGPLELIDFSGVDTILFAIESLYTAFGDPKYRPCPLLEQMVAEGKLGRKSGRGFYEYESA